MNKNSDLATITGMLDLFESRHYPRAMNLKERLEKGKTVNEADMIFLRELIASVGHAIPIIQRNPEYEKLARKAVSFYAEVAELAVKNSREKL